MKNVIEKGDTVLVHYIGKFTNGTTFDSSKERGPVKFKVGDGSLINGFEKAVVGMKAGDKKIMEILPENGYGPYHAELVSTIKASQLPPHIKPQIGLELELSSDEFNPISVIITEMKNGEITLDGNHPLAGKTLVFEVEIVEISNKKSM